MTSEIGTIAGQRPDVLACVVPPTLDPRQAAAGAIAAYLMGATFFRFEGEDLKQTYRPFQLERVQREWPRADQKLAYPCASIVDYGFGDFGASSFTPSCQEDSFNVWGPGTVLWKLDELEADFQIDFFANDKPTREAIAARLPGLFSPGEDTGVNIACGDRYWNAAVRATMLSSVREDTQDTPFASEWRLRTIVRIQIPVLDLRTISVSKFATKLEEIGPCVSVGPSADAGCEP